MRTLLALIVISLAGALSAAAQSDARLEAIRTLAAQTEAAIAGSESDGTTSSTFLTEAVVNRNNGSYPAVGIFRSTVKYYYTFGDRERNPYPDRLLKIIVETKRSARSEVREFLFDDAGRLVFYYSNDGDSEMRLYWHRGKLFRAMKGDGMIEIRGAPAAAALAESKQLAAAFRTLSEL